MSSGNKGYVRLNMEPSSSNTFVQDSFQQQERILAEQDDTLERVGDSLRVIKSMTHQIGDELHDQSEMLDDLSASMLNTDSRMNNVMKKLARLSHLEDDNRQCQAIIFLIGLIVYGSVLVTWKWISFISFLPFIASDSDSTIDHSGYVIYCPCMGRFGNQMEHFLGSLAFAKALNRTLVLPPIIEYPQGSTQAKMTHFEEYFEVIPLMDYHRVVTMSAFTAEIAPFIWPTENRKVGCWAPRPGVYDKSKIGCHATEGNPFGPFWKHVGVKFTNEFYFGDIPGGFDLEDPEVAKKWSLRYPSDQYPVLAFSSAPAHFPAIKEHRHLQKFIHWNSIVLNDAQKFVDENLPRPYIGIHLRNNIDWVRVCNLFENGDEARRHIFASAQCTGFAWEHGKLSREACLPGINTSANSIVDKMKHFGANSVYIASDYQHYIKELQQRLKQYNKNIRVVRLNQDQSDVRLELAILEMSDHFIGNCVSTFSAFVVRQREFHDFPNKSTSFFGFEMKVPTKSEL
ncbi:GDP-fucose protein o-fucosyltransferase domain-containing protein [Ditylenchus destructor]|nr:GDP-fucose protein o-fucosyltransferase domain-containing protein [Ditylenchus destructor]